MSKKYQQNRINWVKVLYPRSNSLNEYFLVEKNQFVWSWQLVLVLAQSVQSTWNIFKWQHRLVAHSWFGLHLDLLITSFLYFYFCLAALSYQDLFKDKLLIFVEESIESAESFSRTIHSCTCRKALASDSWKMVRIGSYGHLLLLV